MAASRRSKRRLEVGRGEPQRACGGVQLGGQLVDAQRDVDADPEDGPALVRAPLGQDPGDLTTVDEHVVGPLDLRVLGPATSATARRRRERQQRRGVAQDERQQQRPPGRRGPRPPLASAPGALLAGGDQRPVRRAGLRERAGAVVGRRRDAKVQPRAPEPRTHAGADVDLGVEVEPQVQRRRAAVDGQRERPVGVLVEQQLAGRDVGERRRVVGELVVDVTRWPSSSPSRPARRARRRA